MTIEQLNEGCQYAENAFLGANSHLNLDKKLISENFNFNKKKILDFGCGMGGMTLWYATKWDCTVHGVDVDSNHIEIAEILKTKHKVKNVNFELRDVLEKPLTEKYDYIILNDVAEHIPMDILDKILVQLKASLAPDGGIFLSYPPWEGPYASHLNHVLGLPWCQFLPDFLLKKIMANKDRVLVGKKTIMQEYYELNHLNHNRLRRIVDNIGLNMKYRKSHSRLNRFSWFSNKNINFGIFKFLITKEIVVFG